MFYTKIFLKEKENSALAFNFPLLSFLTNPADMKFTTYYQFCEAKTE